MAHLMVAHLVVAFFLNAETLRNFHSLDGASLSLSCFCFCLSISLSFAHSGSFPLQVLHLPFCF